MAHNEEFGGPGVHRDTEKLPGATSLIVWIKCAAAEPHAKRRWTIAG